MIAWQGNSLVVGVPDVGKAALRLSTLKIREARVNAVRFVGVIRPEQGNEFASTLKNGGIDRS